MGLFRRKRDAEPDQTVAATPDRVPAPPDPDEAPPPAPADPGFSAAVEGVAVPTEPTSPDPPVEVLADPADPAPGAFDAPPLATGPVDPLPPAPEPRPADVEPLEPPTIAAADSAGAAGTAAHVEGVGGPAGLPPLEEPEVPLSTSAGPEGPALGDRPEVWLGAAFAGGIVFAALLRWLGPRD